MVDFEIQTIGRKFVGCRPTHYEDDLLDFCYVYTRLMRNTRQDCLPIWIRRMKRMKLFLKDKCKTFTLEKEIRDQDFDGLGEREGF